MTAPFEALDVSLTWALTRPLRDAGAVSRFEFSQGRLLHSPRGRARALRERRVEADVRLTATVEGLKRRGRELTLGTHLASGTRPIIASVTEADYEYAIGCHRANAQVVLTRDLDEVVAVLRVFNREFDQALELSQETGPPQASFLSCDSHGW